jgi:hypothetical protein
MSRLLLRNLEELITEHRYPGTLPRDSLSEMEMRGLY